MRTSVVIPSFNTRDVLRTCLASLAGERRDDTLEVIVVENGSSDGSGAMVEREFPWVQLVALPENKGFSGGSNVGLARARGELIIILNSDASMHPGAVAALEADLLARPDAGGGCPLCLSEDGSVQSIGDDVMRPIHFLARMVGINLYRGYLATHDPGSSRVVGAPSGACLCLTRRGLDAIGRLDENLRLYLEENDVARRLAAAGLRCYYVAGARITHIAAVATRAMDPEVLLLARHRTQSYFFRKHFAPPIAFVLAMTAAAIQALTMFKNVFELCLGGGRASAARRRLGTKASAIRAYVFGP